MKHPQKNDKGQTVLIRHPSQPTPLEAWQDSNAVATAVPGAQMPLELNGVPFAPWNDFPAATEAWNAVPGQGEFDEPPFVPAPGMKVSAGVVVEEADGRVWLVHPTNQFGGYACTAAKGTVEHGLSLRASAIKEALEEAGLRVELTGWLADTNRTTSKARYYRAKRIGGNPADMGWESQAVSLVPRSLLAKFLQHPSDAPLLRALSATPDKLSRGELLQPYAQSHGLSSGHRLLATLNAFRLRHGGWPTQVEMDAAMHDALQRDIFSPVAWSMMTQKLTVSASTCGTVVASDGDGRAFSYDDVTDMVPPKENRADVWLWGIPLAN